MTEYGTPVGYQPPSQVLDRKKPQEADEETRRRMIAKQRADAIAANRQGGGGMAAPAAPNVNTSPNASRAAKILGGRGRQIEDAVNGGNQERSAMLAKALRSGT